MQNDAHRQLLMRATIDNFEGRSFSRPVLQLQEMPKDDRERFQHGVVLG